MHNASPETALPPLPRREQFKALGVASLGGMLEYFEFIIFIFLAPQITHHFSSADMPEWLRLTQTFGIFAAGFMIRPISGILMAHLGDLVGRKRIFTLTLALMAAPTLAISVLPGYAEIGIWAPILLLACRILQGISLGGELPGAISFVSEQVSGRRLALALCILTLSINLGSLLGSLVVSTLTHALGEKAMLEYGWRIPFMAGGLFGLVSVYLRRFTQETPVFEAMKSRLMLTARPPFAVLMAEHRFNLFAAMFVVASLTLITVAVQQFPITYFVVLKHLPMAEISSLQSLLISCAMLGNIAGGLLVNWRLLSLRNAYIMLQLVAMVSLFWAYRQDTVEGIRLPFILLGLSTGGYGALSLVLLARCFPAQIRYTGLATCYNIPAALLGGTSLIVLTYLARHSLDYPAFYPALFCLLAIAAAILLWPRRHAINPFDADDPDALPTAPFSSAIIRDMNRKAAPEQI